MNNTDKKPHRKDPIDVQRERAKKQILPIIPGRKLKPIVPNCHTEKIGGLNTFQIIIVCIFVSASIFASILVFISWF